MMVAASPALPCPALHCSVSNFPSLPVHLGCISFLSLLPSLSLSLSLSISLSLSLSLTVQTTHQGGHGDGRGRERCPLQPPNPSHGGASAVRIPGEYVPSLSNIMRVCSGCICLCITAFPFSDLTPHLASLAFPHTTPSLLSPLTHTRPIVPQR
jgi:hypothetical protein